MSTTQSSKTASPSSSGGLRPVRKPWASTSGDDNLNGRVAAISVVGIIVVVYALGITMQWLDYYPPPKVLQIVVAVVAGVGGAYLLFMFLNKLIEALPQRWEERLKPYAFLLPGMLLIGVFLIYPAALTVIYSFKSLDSSEWVGLSNYTDILSSSSFRGTILNNLLWLLVVPILTVVVGLFVATLADRLPARWEKIAKSVIFLPMAISFVGAATIWRFVYAYNPRGSGADRSAQRHHRVVRVRARVVARAVERQPQRLSPDGDLDLVADRLRDGAALRRHQERAGGDPRGGPH